MDIWELLRVHYPTNAYSLLREVRNAAGYNATRSADGIAVGLWPSRGLEIEGLELKAHRQDWIGELKNPAKAEAIFQFCDRWWVVAEKEGIVKQEEVPAPWGFMEARGEKLFTVIKAPKLEPKPLTKGFVVCMLKRAVSGMIPQSEIKDKLEEARISGGLTSSYRVKELEDDVHSLKETIVEFEKESGLHITNWNAGNIGKAVKMITDCGAERIKDQLLRLKNDIDKIGENIVEVINQ
jgi:hypothetical protein